MDWFLYELALRHEGVKTLRYDYGFVSRFHLIRWLVNKYRFRVESIKPKNFLKICYSNFNDFYISIMFKICNLRRNVPDENGYTTLFSHSFLLKISQHQRKAGTRGVLWKKLFLKISQYTPVPGSLFN